ncbi:class D beta-lactamase [Segnochrobactrum spirostomi]|nr:class D beta-lactamase [Segnochrobactrum spirostomi]
MLDRRQFNLGLLMAGAAGLVALPRTAAIAGPTDPSVATVVADADSGRVLARSGPAAERASPCSTFKIPIALMGFETGILEDPTHPVWTYRPDLPASRPEEKGAIDPTAWLRDSVVWYSQEITRKLGVARFRGFVDAFHYGNMDVSGNPGANDGLTRAWLVSSLQISADEQVAFLRRMLGRELGLSGHAYAMTAETMPEFQAAGGWTVHGKTGSGRAQRTDGKPAQNRPLGWFVGWAEKGGRRVVFARRQVFDHPSDALNGRKVRNGLLADLAGLAG